MKHKRPLTTGLQSNNRKLCHRRRLCSLLQKEIFGRRGRDSNHSVASIPSRTLCIITPLRYRLHLAMEGKSAEAVKWLRESAVSGFHLYPRYTRDAY